MRLRRLITAARSQSSYPRVPIPCKPRIRARRTATLLAYMCAHCSMKFFVNAPIHSAFFQRREHAPFLVSGPCNVVSSCRDNNAPIHTRRFDDMNALGSRCHSFSFHTHRLPHSACYLCCCQLRGTYPFHRPVPDRRTRIFST